MATFAEDMKALDKAKKEERLNADIHIWTEMQRRHFGGHFENVIFNQFRMLASDGDLQPIEERTIGENSDHIPGALEITKKLLNETFEPHGIKVTNVALVGRRGCMVKATFTIE